MTTVSHDSETPAHGQQVITACALINHDFNGVRKVFLAKRAVTKKFLPDIYEIPGGHIDFGENIVTDDKGYDDPEFIAIKKAFALFEGAALDFAGA